MNRFLRQSTAACFAVIVAACNGVSQGGSGTANGILPPAERPAHRMSWMAGGLAKQDLLYVTNGNSEVTVYRFWKGTLVGIITSLTQPTNECADARGNVYIADVAAKTVFEFAHGGTKPIGRFDDSPDSPYACAIDPVTGDLAVANYNGASETGSIAIWSAGSTNPTKYTDPELSYFKGCAFDSSGNLLVTDGYSSGAGARFAWLPRGGKKLIDLKVPTPKPNKPWGAVYGIQWDGEYFVLDAYDVYRIALIHAQAYYVGETALEYGAYGSYWIYNNKPSGQGTLILGAVTSDNRSEVNIWHYPSGDGSRAITHGLDKPYGVTVSLKKSR
jgi:hypothetical protein